MVLCLQFIYVCVKVDKHILWTVLYMSQYLALFSQLLAPKQLLWVLLLQNHNSKKYEIQ